jgi:hypothetical protein
MNTPVSRSGQRGWQPRKIGRIRRPTPKIQQLMNPDSAAVHSTRCQVTSPVVAAVRASEDAMTSHDAPAAIHGRNGSRAGAPDRMVRRTTAQKIPLATSNDVLPAIHNGLVNAPSWKKPHAIAITPPSCSQNDQGTSVGLWSVPPTKRGST